MGKIYQNRLFIKNLVAHSAIIIILVFSALPVQAQLPDSVRVVHEKPEKLFKNLRIQNITQDGFNIWHNKFSGHWAGVDFGFNTLTGKGLSGDYPSYLEHDIFRSNSLYANLLQQSIGLQKVRNTVGLVTGIGMQFRSYRLNKNTTIEMTESGEIVERNLVFEDNQKSKFSMAYINVPLLLEFQVPVNHYANRIYASAGILAGYRISSHTKIKYRVEKKKEKLKTPGDFSLDDFKYGLMMRLGYRQFQIFANWDLKPMFNEKANVADTYPFTFGVTLISF